MSNFKIGDRIIAYDVLEGSAVGWKGVVQLVNANLVHIRDANGNNSAFNVKQCRRLIKTKKRRVWLGKKDLTTLFNLGGTLAVEANILKTIVYESEDDFIEFIEVIKKKTNK